MKTIAIPSSRLIRLPKRLFKPTDRVALITQGDTLIIKKIDAAPLSSIALRAKGRPMPLQAIVREVRAYRREKRAR